MARILFGFAFVLVLALFVRHQYRTVIAKITTPQPTPHWLTTDRPYQARRKCLLCGGTGRTRFYSVTGTRPGPSQICPTCNGTGWVDAPDFGR